MPRRLPIENMLTQVIVIGHSSSERLQEILDSMLGKKNFNLVRVVIR